MSDISLVFQWTFRDDCANGLVHTCMLRSVANEGATMIDGNPVVTELRAGAHAAEPGKYQLATRVDRPIVDRGESVRIQVYITGYGRIDAAKLHIAPPLDLLDEKESRIRFDLREVDGRYVFGGSSTILDAAGVLVSFAGGLSRSRAQRPTMFYDMGPAEAPGVPAISTEEVLGGHTVVDCNLAIRDDSRPGAYPIFLTLTYFDGRTWQNSNHTVAITVRSVYQQFELGVALLGAIAAISTVVAMVFAWLTYLKT